MKECGFAADSLVRGCVGGLWALEKDRRREGLVVVVFFHTGRACDALGHGDVELGFECLVLFELVLVWQ
jgi:hypothetical protein